VKTLKRISWKLWIVTLLIDSVIFPAVFAQPTASFSELGHQVDYFDSAAQGQFVKADLDGDGVQDLAFVGTSGVSALYIVGKRVNGTIGFKLSKAIPDDGQIAQLLGWSFGGQEHIISIGANGMVRDYSGWPLTENRQFIAASGAVAAKMGDVDNNGVDDLLVLSPGGLQAYSMMDGLAEWTYPVSGMSDLALAQLDADPATEITLAGTGPGLIIDGATRATDWQYINGFGTRLATGKLDAAAGIQWVGAEDWYQFTVFRSSPWSTLWTGAAEFDIGAIATAKLDSSGRDVILFGDGQWGSVHIVDSITHQERFAVPNEGYGVRAITDTDIDDDGIQDIAFASVDAYSDLRQPLVTVANGQSGTAVWQFFPKDGPFAISAQGDVDGDGSIDLVVSTHPSSGHATVAIFDAETGVEKWVGPASIGIADDPFNIAVSDIKLVPHQGSPGMDIVLAGKSSYDGRISVFDGVTKQVRLQIGHFNSGPMQDRVVQGLALEDYNGDGVQDYIVATASQFASPVSLLQVFSGVDGQPLWTSPAMSSGSAGIHGVLIADPPSGLGGKELVAVMPDGLRAFNSQSGLLTWTITEANDGAVYVPDGATGPEIGVFTGIGALTFYEAKTQIYARTLLLPAPLRAAISPNGDLHSLILAIADFIALVDGETGTIRAVTDYLAPFPDSGSRISASADNNGSWIVASGTQIALFRHRLNFPDLIFADSFEIQPER
jgi:outer membrane protein assembly factor BamB